MTASGNRIADLNERWRDITDQSIGEAQVAIHELLEMLTPKRLAPLIEEAIEAEQATSGGNDYRSRKPGLFIASALLAALEAQDAEVTRCDPPTTHRYRVDPADPDIVRCYRCGFGRRA